MLEFCDTHCHLHFPEYKHNYREIVDRAIKSGVTRMITIGNSVKNSEQAINIANQYMQIWVGVGLHPHYAKHLNDEKNGLTKLVTQSKVVAIGECGLDYYYNHSSKEDQKKALQWQIELALKHDLPIIFHIRDAYEDFWPIVSKYKISRAVVHCFSATQKELDLILDLNWYIGLNGITTFKLKPKQIAAIKAVPLKRMLLETDAPLLTPAPLRGKINEPKNVVEVAEFLSDLRGEPLNKIATTSTKNAKQLFGIN